MRNILDYIKNYNFTFKEAPFNIVDSLVLTNMTYFNLEVLTEPDKSYRIRDVINPNNTVTLVKNTMNEVLYMKFVKVLYTSRRFRNIRFSDVKYVFSYQKEEQYFSMTFHLSDRIYVAFRGTDLSFLGWKENFNMAFTSCIASQEDARIYLNCISKKYDEKIYIGGHSKGGNLAIYSALFSDDDVKEKIVKIYNFDGPGLYSEINTNENYLKLKEKIISITTNKALIGLLLNYVEDTFFIRAKGNAVMCHDLFSWKLNKNYKFIYVKKNSAMTRWFNHAVDDFLKKTTDIERHRYVDVMFLVFDVNSNVNELKKGLIRFLGKTKKRYRALTKDQKRDFKKMLRIIRRSFLRILIRKLLFIRTSKRRISRVSKKRFKSSF